MLLLKCERLSLGYERKKISPEINLKIHSGDFIAVTGENGAGKSTLVKTLLGIVPPLDGKVTLEGGMKQEDIGYLPQSSFTPRDFPASVYEVVLSGCIGRRGSFPFYSRGLRECARKNMERLGVDKLADRSFSELSGGQAQRVLLCRALCAAGRMLLLDEPVQGLDPSATHEMYEAVKELKNTDSMAIIMVSHDICTTLGYADKILHLGREEIFFGSVEEYKRSEIGHEFIFAHGGVCDCEEHSHTDSHKHHNKEEDK